MGFVNSSTIVASDGPRTRTTFNETIVAADTEQSLDLSSLGTVFGYLIRSRASGEIKLTHVALESGTKFMTVPGSATHVDDHQYSGLILYFQSPTISEVIEVVVWS